MARVLPTRAGLARGRQARAAGAVVMKITVDEAGGVAAVEALCGPPPLTQSAVDAASKSRYEPLVGGGKPVKVTGLVSYRYTLEP